MKILTWHHLSEQEQGEAYQWWSNFCSNASINEMKAMVKKHFSDDCRYVYNGEARLDRFDEVQSNIYTLWEKEVKNNY
jgi:hypothetical protein